MKFLLTAINAKFIHSNPAIYSLRAGVGEKLQPYVELAEFTINESLESILQDIYRRKPDVVGFSCYIWNWKLIREILTELPKILPDTEIWLGGPEVTYDGPGLLREFPQVTGIMVGEGEVTFREVLSQYVREAESTGQSEQQPEPDSIEQQAADRTGTLAGKSVAERFGQIPGLCLASGYPAPRELTDLTTLPFLYEDMEPFTNRIIYYETSRGCPYRCSYCLSSIDKKVRLRDIDVVKRELQFFLDHKVPQVKFVDRTFNCKHDHAMTVWRYIKEHDNGITNFHFEVAADLLNEEEMELIKTMRPGLIQLEIGVQSTNLDTIREIHRTMKFEQVAEVVRRINSYGNVHQHLDLIAGLPYEDYESFGKSFDDVYALEPEQLQLGFLKVLKGSYMEEKKDDYGLVYKGMPPYEVLYTKWLPYEDTLRLKGIEEMVETYYNSRQFCYTLPYLIRHFKRPFTLFEKLAEYYEENGLDTLSHARTARYEILYDFARFYDAERCEAYKQLLTLDFYLRENAKSRPLFAGDERISKEEFRLFYDREDEERRYLENYENMEKRQLRKMTHIERFSYDVLGDMKEEECVLLFDYQNRNPLDHQAKVFCVTEEIRELCKQ